MTEKPILFSAPMVLAIREGKKTMTRRIVKPQPSKGFWNIHTQTIDGITGWGAKCPYPVGTRLWVRETWARGGDGLVRYAADFFKKPSVVEKWKPSIFMPRGASRITLEVTAVRVERLQDISIDDCKAEGLEGLTDIGWRYVWGQLWNSINEKRGFGWDVNPFCWVISFKRVKP